MLGRFPLLLALLLLMVPPAAHAATLADRAGLDDPCVDAGSAFDDPTSVVRIANECTVVLSVSVQLTPDGHVIVTIVVAYAEYGQTFVVDCTDPDHLPKVGDTIVWYAPCRGNTAWLN